MPRILWRHCECSHFVLVSLTDWQPVRLSDMSCACVCVQFSFVRIPRAESAIFCVAYSGHSFAEKGILMLWHVHIKLLQQAKLLLSLLLMLLGSSMETLVTTTIWRRRFTVYRPGQASWIALSPCCAAYATQLWNLAGNVDVVWAWNNIFLIYVN